MRIGINLRLGESHHVHAPQVVDRVGAHSAAIADATLNANAALALSATVATLLSSATVSSAGALTINASMQRTMTNATVSATGQLSIQVAINAQLENARLTRLIPGIPDAILLPGLPL